MYLKSDTIEVIFGEDGGDKILHLIRNHLIPQEQSYCFYLRKGVRLFDKTTNSGHEGRNIAIKASPSCVPPQHGIDKSVKFKLTPIPTNLTSTNNIWLVPCLEEHEV
jgi:hypothetical protein